MRLFLHVLVTFISSSTLDLPLTSSVGDIPLVNVNRILGSQLSSPKLENLLNSLSVGHVNVNLPSVTDGASFANYMKNSFFNDVTQRTRTQRKQFAY